ncbi:MAG: xanthine dehydrogenase molybdopterin binding subunit [Pseudomonadota bacterium]
MNTKTDPFLAQTTTPAWAEVGQPRAHESAVLHVQGKAPYIDDVTELQGTLHAALGLSQKAHAKITAIDFSAVRSAPGVVAVLTAHDIPGVNDCGPIIHDDPIFADGVVQYAGQPIFVVIADTHEHARRAVRKVKIEYQDLPAILTPQQARDAQSYVVPPMQLKRGDFQKALAQAPHRIKGELFAGGQEHFYLEGQISYAIPKEGKDMLVLCSTQHPTEMQQVVAHALGISSHNIVVECRRMGGAFGGKETQSALWAAVAAICAAHVKHPVKLRADRDDDMMVTGKRHCFYYEYEVGYDDDGRICAAKIEMVLRAGFSADMSGAVATRAICQADNTYYLSDIELRALCGKTNTQSNTAFRGFGGPQGSLPTEYVIDEIARNLGKDAADVRKLNFYGRPGAAGRHTTPYGQLVKDNVIHELFAELEASSDYRQRRAALRAFNGASPVLKKGIAMTPVKLGISFNAVHCNQAGALVHVYVDGSVLVNHGGTEMGQGLNTKMAQVAAHELGLSLAAVRCTATDTSKVGSTAPTAASTGADLNGKAVQDAARKIRLRLAEVAATEMGGDAADVRFFDDHVHLNGKLMRFCEVAAKAYLKRVQLWADGFYSTPDLQWDPRTMTGTPYSYFAYGAAVSEVVIDTLTGEWKLLRADLLQDVGQSLNPAIDIGQTEGAFIQAMGWLTTEELWWDKAGKLMTHAPSTYKIPAVSDCPDDFRCSLFKNSNVTDSIHRSKAVGEPPMILSLSVFLAIRDAIASVADYRINPPLNAPATGEEILRSLEAVHATARTA